jgi:hypothetical protein
VTYRRQIHARTPLDPLRPRFEPPLLPVWPAIIAVIIGIFVLAAALRGLNLAVVRFLTGL